nr:immunoglobulin heavy chain junction region [Mus musculus]NSM04714.1 immunoglobulin heavy chain junction region [Mus musculus]NSM04868.1 immunoglobulin heavy chain junction region [Mus musculus]NSM05184.1 immunoglobulin heavy chain junction region [Mus musculus]NSM05454.1 immunoglobulin heavy chain junction region [Mus musculus]
CAREGWYFDVW